MVCYEFARRQSLVVMYILIPEVLKDGGLSFFTRLGQNRTPLDRITATATFTSCTERVDGRTLNGVVGFKSIRLLREIISLSLSTRSR